MLAFSENLLGLAPITAPVIALTGSPLLGYNAAFLLSYVFSGLGAYLLAFVLTRRHDASFVAALAFAFAPYRLSHTQHLQLLSSYWMPVAIAALHLYIATPEVAMGGAVRRELADAGARLRLLPVLSLNLRRCSGSAWFAPGRLAIREHGPARRRVGDRGVCAGAGAARLPVDPRVVWVPAQPGRSRELQRRHRGPVVRFAGLAAVERPALRGQGPSRKSSPA